MKEFIKDVGWNSLCFTGTLILVTVAIVLFVVVASPCFLVPGLLVEHWGKEWYTLLLSLAFFIVYWSIVDIISSAIWRKFTGQPKRERGHIYFK